MKHKSPSIGWAALSTVPRGLLFTLAFGIVVAAPFTHARADSATVLPLSLSMEAVNEAIRACDAKGYKVTVSVVDPDGVVKIQARGDGTPIHSQRFSFRKAYTIVSMGPMFGVDTSSALVKLISTFPQGLSNVQSGSTELLFLPGAVLIKVGKETIGSIGVSGAPLSTEDEFCAQAGIAKIQSRLDAKQQ